MRIISINVEELDNAGCNNGNYPEATLTADNGMVFRGRTCNCHRGCSNTWYIDNIDAMDFEDEYAVLDYLNDED